MQKTTHSLLISSSQEVFVQGHTTSHLIFQTLGYLFQADISYENIIFLLHMKLLLNSKGMFILDTFSFCPRRSRHDLNHNVKK